MASASGPSSDASRWLIKAAVRALFMVTSQDRAIIQTRQALDHYLKLTDGLSREAGARTVTVPPMRGIDEDMRSWSFYMILEHNTIVNRAISATILNLVRGEPLSAAAAIDFKGGVMPSQSAGEEHVQEFCDSVTAQLSLVPALGSGRGTQTALHPLFGDFDAHQWTCMFAFHLRIHYKQAAHVVLTAKAQAGR
jgi:hypothetical protein